jgi:hypothetical protein
VGRGKGRDGVGVADARQLERGAADQLGCLVDATADRSGLKIGPSKEVTYDAASLHAVASGLTQGRRSSSCGPDQEGITFLHTASMARHGGVSLCPLGPSGLWWGADQYMRVAEPAPPDRSGMGPRNL